MKKLLCSSVLVPQIAGGLGPPGFETEKISVKHLDARVVSCPVVAAPVALATRLLLFCLATMAVVA